MSASGWVHLDVDEIVYETDNAFLLRVGKKSVWFPKSAIADAEDYNKGDSGTVSVRERIAKEKGLV